MSQYILEILNIEQSVDSIDLDKPLNINIYDGSFIIVEVPSKLEVTLNGESVSIKVNENVQGLTYNGQELNSGGHYFLENGDEIIYKGSRIKAVAKDQSTNATHDGKTLVFNISDIKAEKTEEPKKQEKINSQEPQQSPLPQQPTSKTSTSIDISKLLAQANREGGQELKEKTKKKAKVDKLSGTKIVRVAKKKKNVKKRKAQGFEGIVEEEIDSANRPVLFGPFARVFSIILNILLSIRVFELVNEHTFNDISIGIRTQLQLALTKFGITTVSLDLVKIILIYLILLILGNILLSVSLGEFILGASTQGSFFAKRAKAIVRTPFDILSTIFPLFDISLLIGHGSLKEFITRGRIIYRGKILKYVQLPLFLVIMVFALFPYTILEVALKDKFLLTEYQAKELKYKYSDLVVSPHVNANFTIDGFNKNKSFYLLQHKTKPEAILVKQFETIPFSALKKIVKTSPFAKKSFPSLLSPMIEGDTKKIRDEVVHLLMISSKVKTLNFTNIFPEVIFSYSSSQMAAKFIFKNREPVQKISKYFIANKNRAYYIADNQVVVYDIFATKPDFHPRDYFYLENTSKNELPFQRLIENKAIDGVAILNYLDYLDPMIARLRRGNNQINLEILKIFLINIKDLIEKENPEKFQSLNETVVKVLKSL